MKKTISIILALCMLLAALPVTAGAAEVSAEDVGATSIYGVTIKNVTHPTAGWTFTVPTVAASEHYTIHENASYMKDYGVNGTPGVDEPEYISSTNITKYAYKEGHVYEIIMYLYAKDGYQFSSSPSVTVENATPVKKTPDVRFENSTLVLTLEFAAVQPYVSSPHVSIDEPVIGAYPDYTVGRNVSEIAKFSVSDVKWQKGSTTMLSSQRYEADNAYTFSCKLTAKPGYRFFYLSSSVSASITGYVNSVQTTFTSYNKGAYAIVSYTFPTLRYTDLSQVNISYTGPVIGKTPSQTAAPKITSPVSGATVTDIKWYYSSNYNIASNISKTQAISNSAQFNRIESHTETSGSSSSTYTPAYFMEMRLHPSDGNRFNVPVGSSAAALIKEAAAQSGGVCITNGKTFVDWPLADRGKYTGILNNSNYSYRDYRSGVNYVVLDTNGDLLVTLTFFKVQAQKIYDVNYTMTEPKADGSYIGTITDDNNLVTSTVTWTKAPLDSSGKVSGSYVTMQTYEKYLPGYTYRAHVVSTLASGGTYEFAVPAQLRLSLNSVSFGLLSSQWSEFSINYDYDFPIPSSKIFIVDMDIKNLVNGLSPTNFEPKVNAYYDSVNVSVRQANTASGPLKVANWYLYDETDKVRLDKSSKTKLGHVYTLHADLETTTSAYQFMDSSVKIIWYHNWGEGSKYYDYYDRSGTKYKEEIVTGTGSNKLSLSYRYEPVEEMLSLVELKFDKPKAGDYCSINVDYRYSQDKDKYSFSNYLAVRPGAVYRKSDGMPMTSAQRFEKDTVYQYRFTVTPKNGYTMNYMTDKYRTLIYVNNTEITKNYWYDDKGAVYVYEFTADEAAASCLVGDVNNDGTVNGADSGLLARYTAGWKGYDSKIKNMNAADINRDGKVNGADAGLLARYTAGWKGYDKYIVKI